MQRDDETCRPDSLWRQLLSDWLWHGERAEEFCAQAADERQQARDDVAA